jgi:general secretion pathway protein D
MPGKCITWFIVFSHVSSIALPFNGQMVRQAQAAEPTTPPQAQPPPGAVPPAQPPVAPGPQGTTPAQPGGAPSRPERTLLPPPAVASGGMVSLNFNRADLVEIIHILAQHLRLTYTIDPEVKGTVTINSAEPLRTEDLLPIFHQVLRMNGAVAVRAGNIYRIMPIKDGKGLARPMGAGREDSYALQIVPVRFFSVAEMKKVLTPFVMPGGEIIENPRGNFLVIMDLPSNIQRLVEIADLIDVQVFAGTRMEIYQPKVASAEELATEMTKVMQAYASSVPQPENFTAQFLPLPRINQLLVISHSEAAWTYAKRWLDRIDVIAEGPGRRIFVYAVENGKAEELANVLSAALGLPAPPGGGQRRTLEELHRSTPGGTGQFGGGGQFGGSRSGSSGTSGFGSSGFGSQQPFGAYAAAQIPAPAGQPAAPVPQPAPGVPVPPGLAPLPPGTAPRAPAPGAPGAPTAKPEEQLRIVADPATNSLIVYGTAQEFQNIKNILKELDAVPRQVLLDVLVFEVTLSDQERLGLDYEIRPGNTTFFNRTLPSRGSVLTGLLTLLNQNQADSGGITQALQGVTGIFGPGNVRILVNALKSDSRVKILSAPSVLASDNRPARIQVGSQQPVATGSVATPIATGTTAGTGFATSSTIQYQNTGRIVTIIPQVNSQGLVNLQILAEVSAINQTASGTVTLGTAGTFPSFDIRQAETTAVVQDGDSLAIGGIIAENKNQTHQGIPYLMDVPVLGRFFRTTADTTDRTELIFLITPHVIRNRSEGTVVTEEFKSKLSTLRNDLERMRLERERDVEKMKRDWQDQQQLQQQLQQQQQQQRAPAAPVAPTEPPSPSPSSTPARPEPAVTPLRNINVVPDALPSTPPSPDLRSSTGGSPASVLVSRVLPPQAAPVQDRGAEPAQRKEIPSALSVATLKEPPRVTPVTNPARESSRRGPLWTVQVASLNQTRDAEGIAGNLKGKGYDAYVVAAEVKSKLWHRVRVGQGVDLSEAFELRARLKAKENFDQAFIALR